MRRADLAIFSIGILSLLSGMLRADEVDRVFQKTVAPVFERRCVSCHNDDDRKGDLSLETAKSAFAGGESGIVIVPGKSDESALLDYITGDEPEMPKDSEPLNPGEIAAVRNWIEAGAKWPANLRLADKATADTNWWSLKPIKRPALPEVGEEEVRSPVDRFVLQKLHEHGLGFSREADRRTLIRRLYFDLIGLPPTFEEVEAFVANRDPQAYEKLVDRLLDSPHYGERWARHWLDVVHYGDTHGYDKDKLRPNAWPYRDYVVRAFNEDKPYGRFVQEQIAGDALWPNTTDGIVATGFIAAGPWDFIGHAEVPESKIDGKVARHLDRDDMVATTMNTFLSMTVQCAQCHNHKFDPITQEHYYSLQSVFAALDRADRPYEMGAEFAGKRLQLVTRINKLDAERAALDQRVRELAGPQLGELDKKLAALNKQQKSNQITTAYGYHSQIMPTPDHEKWVQVDLGETTRIRDIIYVGCWDAFNDIFHGFGFPVRYKIEVSNDAKFNDGVQVVVDHTAADVKNPGTTPQSVTLEDVTARYVRVTATKLAKRSNDYIFALAELSVLDADGVNVADGKTVTSLDSIEAPVRWTRKNLVDGYYYGVKTNPDALAAIARLNAERKKLIDESIDDATKLTRKKNAESLRHARSELAALPAKGMVYAGTVHKGSGNFVGTGSQGGKPREIRVLHRGNVTQPTGLVSPGTVPIIDGVDWRFKLPTDHTENDRRAALAKWLTRKDNPLPWRSIVNRIWQYHFGRGIVDSPNDFGRMGQLPTHPELLDWLAIEFRDGGQSIKQLHRLLLNSTTYRQVSSPAADSSRAALRVDAGNRFLWRMNRRKLEAEAIRDSVLLVAGKLDTTMGGPGFRDFVLEKPQHSPHYEYHKHDPDDPKTHRRSIYRFLVRSQPQPFMDTLDCADPSLMVDKRNETLTSLQALALLNNKFMLRMSEHFATRLEAAESELRAQIEFAFQTALGRVPTQDELGAFVKYAGRHGLPNACRVIFNMNEFAFVD